MTIYRNQCTGGITDADMDAVHDALQHRQGDGWGGVIDRLRDSYPAVDYYANFANVRFMLDGILPGRSVYVDTLVCVMDAQSED